ncbi:MAG: hypothetical protein ACREM1_10235 [Longimicrobiales bacterium]
MSVVRMAFVLVVLALLHPGFALLTVGVGTLVTALRVVAEWSTEDERLVSTVDVAPERSSPPHS